MHKLSCWKNTGKRWRRFCDHSLETRVSKEIKNSNSFHLNPAKNPSLIQPQSKKEGKRIIRVSKKNSRDCH